MVPMLPATLPAGSAAAAGAACGSPFEAEDGSDLFDDVVDASPTPQTSAIVSDAARCWAQSVASEVWEELKPLYVAAAHTPVGGVKRPRERGTAPVTNAFAALMGGAKQQHVRCGITQATLAGPAKSRAASSGSRAFHSGILAGYCSAIDEDVQQFAAKHGVRVVYLDSQCVAIEDKFPKAAVHLLLLPRKQAGRLDATAVTSESAGVSAVSGVPEQVSDLAGGHVALLQHMLQTAEALAAARGCDKRLQSAPAAPLLPSIAPRRAFRAGFHSKPSLFPLHMHCISMDMQSAAMKNKTHFVSFMSPFLVDACAVMSALSTPTGLQQLLSECPSPADTHISELRTPGLHTPYQRPFAAFKEALSNEAGQPAPVSSHSSPHPRDSSGM